MEQPLNKRFSMICKRIVLFFIICLTLVACTQNKDCQSFNFNEFGIDTLRLKNNQFLLSQNDTLWLNTIRFRIKSKDVDSSNFMKMAKCDNGVYVDVECPKLNFNIYYFFVKEDSAYKYCIFSKMFETIEMKINTITDIDFQINNLQSESGTETPIKSIKIKDGFISEIIDNNDAVWSTN